MINELIDQLNLVDLPMKGRRFTWCNALDGERWSRIDRFLLEGRWLEQFSFKQWGLPGTISDHCPVMIKEDERNWGPKPFKFINAWLLHPNFISAVKSSWEVQVQQGWAGFRLLRKLASLKASLRRWNFEVFGHVETELKKTEEDLHALDLVAEERALSETEANSRRVFRGLVWNLHRRKESLWHQKSRMLWAKCGDKNTRFFHLMASSRQRRNLLDSVVDDGF
ncbi:uncharacterized protein LOC114310798 [Camellia sinensis]|uniref:uncharacterized protein LOC114310798 n=1 Tax=Camellia sinensis TaxID=4442 RepID=UPI00103640E5|nr:uncharacterized protein LOC114310798 [Camellia sinensis]